MRIQHPDIELGQVSGVFLHLRDDFLLDDGGRHGPRRIEVNRLNACGNLRTLMLHIANYGDKTLLHLTVAHRLHRGGGNIDNNITVAKGKVDACEPLRGGGELAEARCGRHIHRRQRRALGQTGLAQAVAGLKSLDGGGKPFIKNWNLRVFHRQIALDRQPLAQGQHVLGLAGAPDARGHPRPAASIHDLGVALGSLGSGKECFGQQRRRRVGGQCRLARRWRGDALFCDLFQWLDRNRHDRASDGICRRGRRGGGYIRNNRRRRGCRGRANWRGRQQALR